MSHVHICLLYMVEKRSLVTSSKFGGVRLWPRIQRATCVVHPHILVQGAGMNNEPNTPSREERCCMLRRRCAVGSLCESRSRTLTEHSHSMRLSGAETRREVKESSHAELRRGAPVHMPVHMAMHMPVHVPVHMAMDMPVHTLVHTLTPGCARCPDHARDARAQMPPYAGESGRVLKVARFCAESSEPGRSL